MFEVKVKALATEAKSKLILLATWELSCHLAMELIGSACPEMDISYGLGFSNASSLMMRLRFTTQIEDRHSISPPL